MRIIKSVLLTAMLIVLPLGISYAQHPSSSQCKSRAEFIQILEQEMFQEEQYLLAIINSNVAIEIFVNREGQNWTILMSRDDGFSCIVASGIGLRFMDEQPN